MAAFHYPQRFPPVPASGSPNVLESISSSSHQHRPTLVCFANGPGAPGATMAPKPCTFSAIGSCAKRGLQMFPQTRWKVKVEVLVAQLCLTLCDPMDSSPSGSSVHGILQARIWSGLPFAPPGDLPDPGIEPRSLALQADSLPSEPPGEPKPGGAPNKDIYCREACT